MALKVSEIIEVLERCKIAYKVEKQDNCEIEGFSSLFQYKDGTVTFIVPERNSL